MENAGQRQPEKRPDKKRQWNNIQQLVSRLQSLLWTQRLISATAGAVLAIAALGGVWTVLVLVAALATLPVWLKVSLLTLSLVTVAFVAWRFSITSLFQGEVDLVASRLEKRFSQLKGRLIAAVQFQRDPSALPAGTSPELVDLTARQTLELARSIELNKSLDYSAVHRFWKPALALATLVTLSAVFAPEHNSHALSVYAKPLVEVAPPLGYTLSASTGSSTAIRFRDLTLTGHIQGADFPKQGAVHFRYEGGSWQKEEFDLNRLPKSHSDSGDSLAFSARLREVRRSLEFYVSSGRRQTVPVKIEVVDLPRIEDIAISIVAPSYTGLEPVLLNDNTGSFAAVVGSHAKLQMNTNVPLAEAQIVFEATEQGAETLELEPVGNTLSADITVKENRVYTLELTDSQGEKNPDPIEYYITAIEDRNPDVSVIKPGADVDIDESMLLPLKVRISDDFGFSSLALKYTVVSSGRQGEENVIIINFSDNIKTDGEIEFSWDLDKVDIEPGDYLSYYFEVFDNDAISGPKQGLSKVYRARLPSIEELIADMENESEERISSTEEIIRQERKLRDQMQEAQRKLQQSQDNEKLDWQKQKSLEDLADKNEELMSQMEQLADQMKQQLQDKENSSLYSQELLEKLKRVQELYNEVATDEMKESQKRLQEALENMDKDELEDAMNDYQLSQEEMLSRLERTLELLKKLQIEQKINAMTEAAKQLLERQMENNDKTDKADSDKLADLAPEEDKIKKGLEDLKEQAEELDKMLQDSKLDDVPEAKKFSEAVKESDADKDMEEMSESLSKSDREQSSESGEKAETKLKGMLDEMREQQQAMNGNEASKMNAALRRAIEDATYLSTKQEDILDETDELNPRSTALRDLASGQITLQEAVAGFGDRLVKLSAKNPFLSSEIRTLVTDALYNIDESVTHLGETQGPSASTSQRNAMTNLNDVALKLLQSMDEQNQCNKGGSCDKAGQKMQSLGERQSKLNRDTQKNLGPNPKDGPNSDRLRELAGEQESIRKSLKELEKEFGNRQELLGDLDGISKEMQKVIEELSSGNAGGKTAERQLRIYSRMLESVKALNQRDFTPERRAQSGQDFFRPSPSLLDNGADSRPFEDRLQEFLKEGYPPEYETQIRNYFKALNNLNDSKGK
jgi:Domain of unknown function (DUF4175)